MFDEHLCETLALKPNDWKPAASRSSDLSVSIKLYTSNESTSMVMPLMLSTLSPGCTPS
jgi:hypothetical protein